MDTFPERNKSINKNKLNIILFILKNIETKSRRQAPKSTFITKPRIEGAGRFLAALLFFFLELNNRGSRLVAHSHLQKSISNELDLNDHNEGFSLTRMSYKTGKSDASGSRRNKKV